MPEWGSLGIPRFLFPKPVPTRGFVGANPIPTGDNGERRIPGFKAKLNSLRTVELRTVTHVV